MATQSRRPTKRAVAALLLLVLHSSLQAVDACTTFAVGRKATADGSVMSTHTNDGGGTTDPRLVKIPAGNWPEGSMRPIFASPENYPRYVGNERGGDVPAYLPENCQAGNTAQCSPFVRIGEIPQVNHTYAYFEATYGTMNEHQVSIAESTCSGVFVAKAVNMGGYALLSIDQLSQIAMERASTARQAVTLIGALAEEYGFYGESTSFEGGSESLIISDPSESWVFHVLASPDAKSAIWAAARVPDGDVAVVANMFSIRVVDLQDTANFLGRTDMWEIAEKEKLWSPGMPKDFTATFSDGEYSHKYYSGRRMWGVFRLLSPSTYLPSDYDNLKVDAPYPFSVPVSVPIADVTPLFLFSILRDFYNNTRFSTGYPNPAGGPYGSPDRLGGQSSGEDVGVSGNWERTITLYRTSDSYVVQSRSWLPDTVGGVVWFGPHSASATTYLPLLPGLMKSSPASLEWGWQGVFNSSTNFWTNRMLANYMNIKYNQMVGLVREMQNEIEMQGLKLVEKVSNMYLNSPTAEVEQQIEALLTNNVEAALSASRKLFFELNFRFADGYDNQWKSSQAGGKIFTSSSIGYPGWWLEEVRYPDGPPPASVSGV